MASNPSVFSETWPRDTQRPIPKKLALIALAILLAIVALGILSSADEHLRLTVLILFAGVLFLCGIAYVIRHPPWIIVALLLEEVLPYLNVIPLEPNSRWFLRYPLLIPIAIPACWSALKSGILWRGRFKWFLAFFGWATISVAYSLRPEISAGRLIPDVLLFGALAAITVSIRDAAGLRLVMRRLLAGCSLLQLALFLAWIANFGDAWILDEGLLRFAGIFSTPNAIGSLLMVTVSSAIVCWPDLSGWRKAVAVATVISALFFSVLADSRSETFLTLFGVASYIIWRRGRAFAVLCGVAAVIAVILYSFAPPSAKAYLNRDVSTLTGRTEAWQFEMVKLKEKPFIGYGYQVEGEIFQDRHFTNWQKFWDMGPNTSLHNGYMSIAIGMGIPALVFWLILIVSPWIWLLRQDSDPWQLKQLFFLIVLPILLLSIDESGIGEPRDPRGLLFFLVWQIAEHYRVIALAKPRQVVTARPARRNIPVPASLFGALAGLCLISLTATPLWARDYYVDATSGNDANSGTSPAQAWRTLAKVDHYSFRPGDHVMLSRGSVWRETLEPDGANDGNFNGLTFSAYGVGELPIINGSDVVTHWIPVQNHIYRSQVLGPVFNVFVDQSPGWGLRRACCLSRSSCSADAEQRYARKLCAVRYLGPATWLTDSTDDSPHAGGSLYIWLPDGDNPSTHNVEVATRQFGIFAYTKPARLDNFTIDHLRVIQTGIRGISLQSSEAAGCCGSRGVGAGNGLRGLVLRDLEVARTGTGRIDDGHYGNAITIINSTAPLIERNLVSFCGNHGNCINVQNSNGARILNNAVDHWNHNGIDIKGSRDVLVAGNLGRDEPDDGAAFYTEYSSDVVFRNNVADDVSNGFQISVGAKASVFDNTIRRASTVLYFGPRAFTLNLRDNVATGCKAAVGTDGIGILQQSGNNWNCATGLGALF